MFNFNLSVKIYRSIELKVRELNIICEYDLKKKAEKEEEKAIREERKEEEKALREIEREREKKS